MEGGGHTDGCEDIHTCSYDSTRYITMQCIDCTFDSISVEDISGDVGVSVGCEYAMLVR